MSIPISNYFTTISLDNRTVEIYIEIMDGLILFLSCINLSLIVVLLYRSYHQKHATITMQPGATISANGKESNIASPGVIYLDESHEERISKAKEEY